MTTFTVVATGLRFPEGPIAMPDGSVILVEIHRGTLSRVSPEGSVSVVAELGGGPNGAAIGPDGKCYVCNNGGFKWYERDGLLFPGLQPDDYSGGRIEQVDLNTGEVKVLYTGCDGVPLKGPNDIVFDSTGGFWFTDPGKLRRHDQDRGRVYYARPDGSEIRCEIFPLDRPNGIGLSPDEQTLYVSETLTGRVWAFPLEAPGRVSSRRGLLGHSGELVAGLPGLQLLDSLAIEAGGNICVATIINGGITVISPADGQTEHIPLPDAITTNICFGGEDLRTAYVTLSSTGRLVKMAWPRPGLPLNFLSK
ncbi:MAG: SMP-30/gluconolactonase/LRE family protein [Nitrospinota bacterium]|nr:MAG: SMP-30/gluconolactonase/LRE family protein [Nitrospinota bacterium]